MLKAVPIEFAEANAYVNAYHRHHVAVKRDKFRVGCEYDGRLVGVIQVGNPVARMLCDGKTLEVVRLCTDSTVKGVCSFLYSKAARIAKELGYSKIITYILDTEDGTSLKAAGWVKEADVKGHKWHCPSRPREQFTQVDLFGENRQKYPANDKQRWSKVLI